MSIVPLPSFTANRLTAAYAVQSFEAAIQQVLQHSVRFRPTVIDVTVHAQALRFTVRDNRSHVPHDYIDCLVQHTRDDHRHTPFFADSYPLPALAATSTVELRVRTQHLAAVHVVHASSTLERRVVPKTDATSILPSKGVQIDVWQTFTGIPVRRQIELSRSVQSLTQAVRYAVVTIAMANPQISLTLHGPNNLVLFRALAENRLSLSRIQTAFADACHQHWVPVLVNRHSRFRISGFVAVAGLAHSRLQLLSVDSIPSGNVALHSAVREAWRCRYSTSIATVEAPHRRFAAYVINCYFLGTEQTNTQTTRSPRTPNDRELHSVLSRAVLTALRKVASSLSPLSKAGSELSANRTDAFCAHTAQELTSHSLHVGKKRPRFADAVVLPIKRKPPSSTCFNPTSGSSNTALQLVQNAGSTSDMPSSINAQKSFARGLFLRSSPALDAYKWSNRCIGTRPRPSPTARVSKDETENSGNLFNDKCISIGRETIETLRVVGQVEKKFIVVMDNNSTMYAIDQHAASERLLYERNLRETTTTNVKSWTLPRSRRINVSEDQKAVAEEQRTLLGEWGWTVGLTEGESTLELIQVPQLFRLTGCESIVLRDPEQLRSFLNSLLDGAARGGVPPPFNDAIASAACHAAVRFGDILSKSQCCTLVQSLAQCENPFVCAHGRPSIVPLVMLQEQESV